MISYSDAIKPYGIVTAEDKKDTIFIECINLRSRIYTLVNENEELKSKVRFLESILPEEPAQLSDE